MLSRPGEADSIPGTSLFFTRTMGRLGDCSMASSSGVGSAYLRTASMSRTIIAKGFLLRPYHPLMSSMRSRVQQMCIPPHPLITARQPPSSISARRDMGSSLIVVTSGRTRRYEGPQAGQQIVW